jgi:hypothetical protein
MKTPALFLMVVWMIAGATGMPAQAQLTVKAYDGIKKDEIVKVHINGVGRGYAWANAQLILANQQPLYCQPDKLALDIANYIGIIDREIKDTENKYTLDTPVELILLRGLQKTFPCGGK